MSDQPATATDCDGIHLNPLFSDYVDVLAMCRFFLSESYLDLTDATQANYCFLVPVEYVFEDFLRGFLEDNFGEEYKIEYQKTDWLTDEQLFQLRHDLFLTHRISGQRLIVDAKYKVRGDEGTDKKAGVAQSDMYHLVSYCLRSNCRQGLLLYPGADGQAIPAVQPFTISSELMRPEKNGIVIRAASLSVTGILDDGNKREAYLKKTIQQLLDLCI